MPLLLTNPKDTGDLDPNYETYDYVKIIMTKHRPTSHTISLTCQYGNDDGYGTWNAGILQPETHTISGSDYLACVTQEPEEGETAYVAISRILYTWLTTNEYYDGTYVE
jgi:hypothetical protein